MTHATPPRFESTPAGDDRDRLYDSLSREFAAPLARLASVFEESQPGLISLLEDMHVALWHSLAVHDGALEPRTWVFRAALQTVAEREPHMQGRDPNSLTWTESRARRRWQKNLRALPQVSAVSSGRELLLGLQPPHREISFLFLEGLGEEEAARISGWPPREIARAWRHLEKLLSARVIEEWREWQRNAEPVSRDGLCLRSVEVVRDERRKATTAFRLALFLLLYLAGKSLLDLSKERWLQVAAFAIAAIPLTAHALSARRKIAIAAEMPPASPPADLVTFHRGLLLREDEKSRIPGDWKDWLFAPAIVLYVLSFPLESGTSWAWPIGILGCIALIASAQPIFRRRARVKLSRRIDRLGQLDL